MGNRFMLATAVAAVMLTGCATEKKETAAAEDDFTGSAKIHVTHIVTRADDGSGIHLTVDGKDAGLLSGGESIDISLPVGKHQIGGYVQTLLGYGRVTLPQLDITTSTDRINNITYAVTRTSPGFSESSPTSVTKAPAPQPVEEPAAGNTGEAPDQGAATDAENHASVVTPPAPLSTAPAEENHAYFDVIPTPPVITVPENPVASTATD